MNIFNKYIEDIPRETKVEIIKNQKEFKETGILGPCALRTASKELSGMMGQDAMRFADVIAQTIAFDFALELIKNEG